MYTRHLIGWGMLVRAASASGAGVMVWIVEVMSCCLGGEEVLWVLKGVYWML